MSAISAFSASRRRAPNSTRSRSAARPTRTPSVGEIIGRGFGPDEITDAIETMVDTYLAIRSDAEENSSTPIAGSARRRSRRRSMLAKPRPRDGEAEALGRCREPRGALRPSARRARSWSCRSARSFTGGIAAVSSFGADPAVLLDIIARVDRSLPVLFLDTGKHFEETLTYRDALVADFGLTDIRVLKPDEAALERLDPDGRLHQTDTDACCDIRKVEPLARGVAPFRAWFTGRKRHQAATRAALPVFEAVGPRVRINPLARWTTSDQADYMRSHRLRENPLVAYGYLSIGCFPCTQPVKARRGRAQRPLGRPGQGRVRHPPLRARRVARPTPRVEFWCRIPGGKPVPTFPEFLQASCPTSIPFRQRHWKQAEE